MSEQGLSIKYPIIVFLEPAKTSDHELKHFNLETISGRQWQVFSSELWRKTSNGNLSIADWVYGTDTSQAGFILVTMSVNFP